MRLLGDENFPLPTIEALQKEGHAVESARTPRPAMKDEGLLDRAEAWLNAERDMTDTTCGPHKRRGQRLEGTLERSSTNQTGYLAVRIGRQYVRDRRLLEQNSGGLDL